MRKLQITPYILPQYPGNRVFVVHLINPNQISSEIQSCPRVYNTTSYSFAFQVSEHYSFLDVLDYFEKTQPGAIVRYWEEADRLATQEDNLCLYTPSIS